MSNLGYLDLFSGIGGFHLGLKQAGIKPSFTAFSEIDKHASSVYQTHFNNSIPLGDVRTIKPIHRKINNQKINLITFGFPCQDLSIAGKGKGLEGNRSSLFFEAIRLIRELKPNYFIFENVKGLFSSRQGEDFKAILQAISNIGYDGQWQLINTAWFLPQNRERIYFVGYPRGKYPRTIFPLFKTKEIYTSRKRTQIQQANTLKARDYSSWRGNFLTQLNKGKSQGLRLYNTDCSCALVSQAGGLGAKTGLYAIPVLTPERIRKRQQGRRFKDHNDNAFTITSQDRHGIYDGYNIRRLTALECERLQGFNDNWTINHSDNQRYKMLGNAVSVPVVRAIINKIYK